MPLSYPKLVKGIFLLSFVSSSVVSCLQFHTNAIQIAGLSLVGFIAFDVVCFLRDKSKPAPAPDMSPELEKIKARQEELEVKFNTVANDISLAKVGAAFRR